VSLDSLSELDQKNEESRMETLFYTNFKKYPFDACEERKLVIGKFFI